MVYDRNLEEIDTRTVRGLARTKKVKCLRLKGVRKIGDFSSNNRFSRKRTPVIVSPQVLLLRC